MRRPVRWSLVVTLAGATAAGAAAPAAGQRAPAVPAVVPTTAPPVLRRPLERLASEHILVLPVRYLTFTDSLGWSVAAGAARRWLAALDDEIAYTLRERGLGRRWTMAPAIEREAAAAGGILPDPRDVDATALRMGSRTDEWQLGEPAASQLRALVALTSARYVLYPVEVRTAGGPGSGGRATLHVVVVDARRSHVEWTGEITGTPVRALSPAVAADLASKLGELIAPVAR